MTTPSEQNPLPGAFLARYSAIDRSFLLFLLCAVIPGVIFGLFSLLVITGILTSIPVIGFMGGIQNIAFTAWFFLGSWTTLKWAMNAGSRMNLNMPMWLILAVSYEIIFLVVFYIILRATLLYGIASLYP